MIEIVIMGGSMGVGNTGEGVSQMHLTPAALKEGCTRKQPGLLVSLDDGFPGKLPIPQTNLQKCEKHHHVEVWT